MVACQKKDDNDDATIAALLFALQNQGSKTCTVSLSGFSQGGQPSVVENIPITKVSGLNREVTIQFTTVPNTNNHKIGVINVVAKQGTELTIEGGNFFSVVFERGLGCPIGDDNKQTRGQDFEYIGGTVTNSSMTFNQDSVTQLVTIQFKKAGNFYITPYLLNAGPINQLSTEGNLKARITKLQ